MNFFIKQFPVDLEAPEKNGIFPRLSTPAMTTPKALGRGSASPGISIKSMMGQVAGAGAWPADKTASRIVKQAKHPPPILENQRKSAA